MITPIDQLSLKLKSVTNDLIKAGAVRIAVVGGWVRDSFMNVESKDIDIEVFGLTQDQLKEVLETHGKVDDVGVSFAVLKFHYKGEVYDFSLPRTEVKIGEGHRAFEVTANKDLSYAEASLRRDYTMNSMGLDMVTGELYDPHGGYEDLLDKKLKATSPAFSEDVLRVYRGFQFCGRFDLKADEKTIELCKSLRNKRQYLSVERIREEWTKWALKSKKPSAGLQFLIDSGWSVFYPEFHNNIGVKQNPKFHGEIFVELHTQYVCDEAVAIATRENLSDDDRLVLVMSALLHDCAKYKTSIGTYPDIRSPMHAELGAPMARNFLERLGMPEWLIKRVVILVKSHMRHYNCSTDKAVRKLAVDLEPSNIRELCLLVECDYRGRGSTSSGLPFKAKRMLELSQQEKVYDQKPKRILEGKHLKEMGITPSPLYGKIISKVYEEQIKGSILTLDEAKIWVRKNITSLSDQNNSH